MRVCAHMTNKVACRWPDSAGLLHNGIRTDGPAWIQTPFRKDGGSSANARHEKATFLKVQYNIQHRVDVCCCTKCRTTRWQRVLFSFRNRAKHIQPNKGKINKSEKLCPKKWWTRESGQVFPALLFLKSCSGSHMNRDTHFYSRKQDSLFL